MPDQPTHLPSSLSDPSALTTQMVLREVNILDGKMDEAIATRHRDQSAIKELFETKLDDMSLVREEKFHSIETQFALIERQRVEQKMDTKAAVDAALIAQKEAVQEQTIASGLSIAKSETATAKQLDQLASTMTVAVAGVTQAAMETKDNFNSAIGDIKDRVGKIEALKLGAQEQRVQTKDNINMGYVLIGIIWSLLSLASLAVTIFK